MYLCIMEQSTRPTGVKNGKYTVDQPSYIASITLAPTSGGWLDTVQMALYTYTVHFQSELRKNFAQSSIQSSVQCTVL